MSTGHPSNIPELLRQLLDRSDLPALGPQSRPGARPGAQIEHEAKALLSKLALSDRAQDLIRGTLLLWHDHLEAAHTIAQAIEDADGSLLHAIMHRRESDYWNSKYWFRRVGKHPCYPAIANGIRALLKPEQTKLASAVIPGGVWDPFAFVDLCEKAAAGAAENEIRLLQEIQKLEIESFLDHLGSAKLGRSYTEAHK